MKLIRSLLICLSFGAIALTSCSIINGGGSSQNKNSSGSQEHQEVYEEARKDSLFEYGKTTGYEMPAYLKL